MKWIKISLVHLILLAVLLIVLFTLTSLILSKTTRHGDALSVPDITGLHTEDALSILNENGLRYLIIDSLFFDDKPKLTVLDQNPAADAKVKQGRIIYLTINSDKPPGVRMPNLIDVSYRQAQAMLKAAGLKEGRITYRPDIAQNVVLEQLFQNSPIAPETKLPKGSTVDLILGSGVIDSMDVNVPDLTGLSKSDAYNLLISASLNLGAIVYQGAITDTPNAVVYKQNPAAGSSLKGGYSVDLYLKQE